MPAGTAKVTSSSVHASFSYRNQTPSKATSPRGRSIVLVPSAMSTGWSRYSKIRGARASLHLELDAEEASDREEEARLEGREGNEGADRDRTVAPEIVHPANR